jgi:hypothetical protein
MMWLNIYRRSCWRNKSRGRGFSGRHQQQTFYPVNQLFFGERFKNIVVRTHFKTPGNVFFTAHYDSDVDAP